MSSNLIPFSFEGSNVRVHVDADDKPWWIAADVCRILGISNVSNAVGRLQSDEKSDLRGIGETDTGLIINESGLYRLIFRSNKLEAKRFQKWVFSEVLPQIRQTGRYQFELPTLSDPALQAMLIQGEQVKQLLIGLDEARKDAAAATANAARAEAMSLQVMQSQQYMTIREFVMYNDLTHQLPPGTAQQAYGRFLVGYCQEKGWPLRKMQTENHYGEWAYPSHIIQQTIFSFLSRHYGQISIEDDGVWSKD